MKKLIKIISMLPVLGFLLLGSCRLFENGQKESAEKPVSVAASVSGEEKTSDRTAAEDSADSSEETTDGTAERNSLIPEEDKSAEIYAMLPKRAALFLQNIKEKMEKHEWEWIISRAKDHRYRPALETNAQTQASYVYALLGFGKVINSDSDVWIQDVDPVYPRDVVRLEYTAAEKIFLSHLVEAVVYDVSGTKFPLLFEILSELDDILIAEAQ